MLRFIMLKLALFSATFSLLECAAYPEEDTYGACTLDCSRPVIASADYILKPIIPQYSLNCDAVEFTDKNTKEKLAVVPYHGPIRIQFKVEKKIKNYLGGGTDSGSGSSETEETGGAAASSNLLPVAGVGFIPNIATGVMANEKTNPDIATVDTSSTPAKIDPFAFAGILTPKEEWCSDSCGIMTLEVWPSCVHLRENKVLIDIAAGPLSPSNKVAINLEHTGSVVVTGGGSSEGSGS